MASDLQIRLGLDASELLSSLNKAISELNKAISNINNTKVDINEAPIVADMNKIQAEAKETGAAIDKNLSGGAVGGGLDSLKGKLGGFKDLIPGLSGGVGDLGSSFQALTGGVTSLVPGLGSVSGILAGGGIAAGIAAVGAGVAYSIDKGKEFETQLASLSSITGVSGPALDDLGEKAKIMASKFGTDATANIESFKTILSKLGPDIAKSPEALNSMAESVNTLSKATGDDPGKATEALTGALLQFGVSLDDPIKAADAMKVAMNVLAAGAKEGASEVPDVAAAINVAGVAAKSAKVSFEETNSAIQVLAAGGKVGAEAGTSLRNVLNTLGAGRFLPKDTQTELKAAGVDINKLGDTTISMSERLRELNKISGDAALKTKLFGTDAAAASILIEGANGNMDELTKKLTGTNTAYDQAAINMNTFDESLNRIKSNVDNFAISFYDGMKMSFGMLAESTGPAISEAVNAIGEGFSRMWSVVQPILALIGGILINSISFAINMVAESFTLVYELGVYAFDGIMNALNPLVQAIKSALGMDGEAGKSIDVMKILQGVMNGVGAAISIVFDAITTLGKIILDVLIGGFNNVIKVITTVGGLFVSFGKWIGDLILKIPGVKSVFEGLKSAFDGVYNFFANLPKVINEVQVYLKAIGYTFDSVFKVLGSAFDDVLKLDFSSAAKKVGMLFDTSNWNQAFSAGMQKARNELKSTTEAAKKAGDEFKKFQTDSTGGGGGGGGGGDDDNEKGGKGGDAGRKEATILELRRKEYQSFLKKLKIDRDAYELTLEGSEEEKSRKMKERLAQDNIEAKKKLNELARNVSDTKFDIDSIVIKAGKDESFEDVKGFYVEEYKKLQDALDKDKVKIKVDLSWRNNLVKELEEFVKEVDTFSKDYSKILADSFNKPVNTSSQLEAAKKNFSNISAVLTEQGIELEDKLTLARNIGDEKAIESLTKLKETNKTSFDDITLRYNRFVTDSKKAIDESSFYFQSAKAFEAEIQKAFSAESIRQEREAIDKAREEKLAALNQEEGDLEKSLAKREISFEEYSSKISDIEKRKNEANESESDRMMNRLKTAGDKAAASVFKSQADIFNKNAESMEGNEKVFNQFIGQTLSGFSELAASGTATLEDFGKMAAGAAFDAVGKMIPSFVTGILGSSITTLGPILGPITAATLTGTLYGLLGLARTAAGFKDGVVSLNGEGTETSDSIPAWLSKGESVITARGTRANMKELEWINKTGKSISEYYFNSIPISNTSVNDNGELIREVQKLREETRGLGSKISRNTKVEVSGILSGDSRSIKAIIDSEKRRIARRG